jgi:hypothetical protein
VDRLVLASLQRPIPSCDDQMAFIGHHVLET